MTLKDPSPKLLRQTERERLKKAEADAKKAEAIRRALAVREGKDPDAEEREE